MSSLEFLIKAKLPNSKKPLYKLLGVSRKTAYNKLKDTGTMTLEELQSVCRQLKIGIVLYDKDTECIKIERKEL